MTDEAVFGRDLDLGLRVDEGGRILAAPYTVGDLQAVRRTDVAPRTTDLATVHDRYNLVQALVLRLMTERGELAPLGLPDFGSRHHRLIGEPNTEGNRALLKLYVLECLRQDPRVESVARAQIRPGGPRDRGAVEIELTVQPRGDSHPLNLVVPFTFAGGRA
jgi:phage baseplate assembly protein W